MEADFNGVLTAVSTVGFPIAACAGLFYLYDKTIKELTITLARIDTTIQTMIDKLNEMEK